MKPDLTELALLFTEAFPKLDETGRQQALTLYKLLAQGQPVTTSVFAGSIGKTPIETQQLLDEWTGVYYQPDGDIVGFWGLSVSETAHQIIINDITLYTWCAWDTLFIPNILQTECSITTHCPLSQQRITLTVSPDMINTLAPDTAVISFIKPELQKIKDNVVQSFCQQIFFLASETEGQKWCNNHPDAFILSMDQGFQLGQQIVRQVFFSND
jgi:alkylmercury lyase